MGYIGSISFAGTTTMTRSLRDSFWFDTGIYNKSTTTMSTTTPTITPFVSTTMTTNSTTATFLYDHNAIVTNMMWELYDSFNQPNYLLITLYVPVIALAVTANALVIAVVFKYHYMRRYVLFIIYVNL